MKYVIQILLVLLIVSIISCSNRISVSQEELKFNKCLPADFRSDLSLLNSSFNEFLKRNFDNNIKDYIKSIQSWEFPDVEKFSSEDFSIGKQLAQNNFRDNIYTVYLETPESQEIQIIAPRSASDSGKEHTRKRTKVDVKKPYLKCIEAAKGKSVFLNQYLKVAGAPPAICKLLLTQTEDPDLKTELSKTIIAVELYYMILEIASQSPYANNLK